MTTTEQDVDARGLSCPQPVLMAMRKMESLKQGSFTVLVDAEASKENVIRAAASGGWTVEQIETGGPCFRIHLRKQAGK